MAQALDFAIATPLTLPASVGEVRTTAMSPERTSTQIGKPSLVARVGKPDTSCLV